MHIALISPAWPMGTPNGIVTYVHHLRGGLQALGHTVSVLAFSDKDSIREDGVYPIRSSWRTRAAWKLGRLPPGRATARAIADTILLLHRQLKIDVVEMEESFGWFYDVQHLVPMPVVVKLHGPGFLSLVEEELLSSGGEERILAEGRALKKTRFVTSPSLDTLERTRHKYAMPADWGRVIPNPIALDRMTPIWSRPASRPETLLFVGRFDKRKGGDLVIRAFGRLLKEKPELRLLFVGPDAGVVGDDGRRTHIEEFIRTELPEMHTAQVSITGRLDQAVIANLRCEAAVTLVCSRWENQPNTALEAMLQGCPLVGINVGGLGEVIEHRRTGLLAQAGDLDDLCRQVMWLLDNPSSGELFGAAAREHVLHTNGSEQIAIQTSEYFRSLLRRALP